MAAVCQECISVCERAEYSLMMMELCYIYRPFHTERKLRTNMAQLKSKGRVS